MQQVVAPSVALSEVPVTVNSVEVVMTQRLEKPWSSSKKFVNERDCIREIYPLPS